MNTIDSSSIMEDWHRTWSRCERNCTVCEEFITQLTLHIRDSHTKADELLSDGEIFVKTEVHQTDSDCEDVEIIPAEPERPHQKCLSLIDITKDESEDDIDLGQDPHVYDPEQNQHIASFLAETIFTPQDDEISERGLTTTTPHPDSNCQTAPTNKRGRGRPRILLQTGVKPSTFHEANPKRTAPNFHTVEKKTEKKLSNSYAIVEKLYNCTTCKKRFSTSSGLEKHITTTHEDVVMPCKCTTCGVFYDNRIALAAHKARAHRPTKDTVNHLFKERLYKASDLNLQIKRGDASNSLHSCQICGKSFMEEKNLASHLITHSRQNYLF